ncbi:hypothetical protein GOODEAATRI_013592, partial [Goodea atripinnis]
LKEIGTKRKSRGQGVDTLASTAAADKGDPQLCYIQTHKTTELAMNVDLNEDGIMSEWEAMLELDEALAGWLLQGPASGEWGWEWGWAASNLQDPEWDNEDIPAVLSPTYKQRNEDFRKLFKQLPDTERLIVGIPLNMLTLQPLCPKELWHFVHQCYGNELGLTSDDEDYVPPDDDFNTMGFSEEIPNEENEINNDNLTKNSADAKPEGSPPSLHKNVIPNNSLPSPRNHDTTITFELPAEEFADCLPDGELLTVPLVVEDKNDTSGPGGPIPSPSLDFNDNEDIPTELSDSSETHDEGEVQAFHEDLNGRQHINEVYKFSVDKLYDILFTESQFMSDFMEQRRFSDIVYHPWKKEEAGNQTRVIMYTISLSNPLAPKTATVTETQESECYIIDAEVITHDVPYHDYFYTLNRYMLTRVAKNKCRLRISTELRYRKQPWGLVKGFIEKNFWSGLEENFRQLEVELSKLEELLMETHQLSPKAKVGKNATVRRKKRPLPHIRSQHLDEALSPVTTPTDEDVIQRIKHVVGSTQTRHQSPQQHHLPGGIALYSVSKLLLIISFVKLPQTQMEWAQLLEAQQRYHDAELQKWREIIKSSVVLLDQVLQHKEGVSQASNREKCPLLAAVI